MSAFASFLIMALTEGGMVFIVAWAWCRLAAKRGRSARVAAMGCSCLAAIVLLIAGYFAMGGSGALMEGFGLVLVMAFACAAGSLPFTILWASMD